MLHAVRGTQVFGFIRLCTLRDLNPKFDLYNQHIEKLLADRFFFFFSWKVVVLILLKSPEGVLFS